MVVVIVGGCGSGGGWERMAVTWQWERTGAAKLEQAAACARRQERLWDLVCCLYLMSTLCSLASLRARRTNKAYHARPRALPVVLHRCPNICLRYLELRSQGGYGALCMSCVIP